MKICLMISVASKKSPNLYKSCPKMISLEKIKDFDTFTKIGLRMWGDLGKIIVAKGFKKLLKVQ